MALEQPQRITTDFFTIVEIQCPAPRLALFGPPRPYTASVITRQVAIKSPEGKYCVRSEQAVVRGHVERDDPFSWGQQLKDKFNRYADFTLSFEEAASQLRAYQEAGERKWDRYTTPKDAAHILHKSEPQPQAA